MSFTIQGVDYNSVSDQNKNSIKQNVAGGIAAEISGVAASDVSVALSAGSVKVDATIRGSNLNEIANEINAKATTLASSIVSSVSSIAGLPTTGPISIPNIQADVAEAPTLSCGPLPAGKRCANIGGMQPWLVDDWSWYERQ